MYMEGGTLRVATMLQALIHRGEVIFVASAAAVSETFADAISTVIVVAEFRDSASPGFAG